MTPDLPDPEDMHEAESDALWLEVDADGWRVTEGETKADAEVVESGDGFFTAILQSVDTEAGDYEDSKLYKFRHPEYDEQILFWGKTDFNNRIEAAGIDSGDTVAVEHLDTVEIESGGEEREMERFRVRYERL